MACVDTTLSVHLLLDPRIANNKFIQCRACVVVLLLDVKVDAATYIVIGHSTISHISFIRDLATFWLLLALTVGIQLIIRVHKYEMKLDFQLFGGILNQSWFIDT